MWIALIIVIAFITVCELLLFYARRHGPFVAKLHGPGYLVKADAEASRTDGAPHRPEPRDEEEPH